METIKENNAEAIRELVKLGERKREVTNVSSPLFGNQPTPFIVIKEGETVRGLSDLIPTTPDRIRTKVELDNVESFIAYLKEFKKPETRVFSNAHNSIHTFTALIDYHNPDKPSWITHKCILTLTETDEWEKWISKDNHPFSQLEFSLFIENNINEIINPDGATMLELALTLEASQDVKFRGKQNLQNGDTMLLSDVNTEMKAGKDGTITIPKELTLNIIPFKGLPPATIQARFRTILRNGQMTLGYQMIRPNLIIDTVIENTRQLITKEAMVPVFGGVVQ